MIPLGDASRRTVSFPIVTAGLICANAFVFVLELLGGDDFIITFSMVPADVVSGHHLYTLITSMFMHAGWEHIIGNMVFLWAFGPEVEDAMGGARYLMFYLLGGLASSVAEIAIDPISTVPSLGASGAIAAVMGAFLITYPRDQIKSILVIGWFARVTLVPALVFIGLWFFVQLFSEVGTVAGVQSDGVAYMAHIGGIVFGAATARLFEVGHRQTSSAYWNK
jgi:membrane associated rhomboid family serine protease